MRAWFATVAARRDDGRIVVVFDGGPFDGQRYPTPVAPLYPPNSAYPPPVDARVLVLFLETEPLGAPRFLGEEGGGPFGGDPAKRGFVAPDGVEVVYDATSKILDVTGPTVRINNGTLGAARYSDPVNSNFALQVFFANLTAALAAADTQLRALGAAGLTVPSTPAAEIGNIAGGSSSVLVGD